MYYDFLLACDRSFIDKICALTGKNNFFIASAGSINYLFAPAPETIAAIRECLTLRRVILYEIPEEEMLAVLETADTNPPLVFHGSKELFDNFKRSIVNH